MKAILVTGNKNKLEEIKHIFKGIEIRNEKIDLDEIQSLDLYEICEHKVKQAYQILKEPVIVEDTGFFLDELKGLPGPFIKFFNSKLGNESLIKLLGNSQNRKAYSMTVSAFYDGKNLIFGEGILNGTVTYELKNGEGFGFDFCFTPEGYDKTLSEIGLEEKNKISHRALSINNLKIKLDKYKNKT